MSEDFYKIYKEETKVLVTGGAGFIGGCLIRRLLNNTNAKIFNLDKLSYASDLSWLNYSNNKNNYKLINLNLKDSEAIISALKDANPDYVIHLAAESHVDRSIDNPSSFIESNIVGTFNLLNAVKIHFKKLTHERKNSFRFLHVSTDEVYGSLGSTGFFTESTPYDPRSPYSASKAASDHLVKAWHHTYDLPILLTNCSNNFGPYQFPEKLIPLVINKAINKKEIPIYGDGLNVRDWLFVEDHIDALLKVISFGTIGKCYCIGGFGEKNNLEIVKNICEILDSSFRRDFNHQSLIKFVTDRPGHDKRYSIDSSLIQNELNWAPKKDFLSNLKFTVDWYLQNTKWIDNISAKSDYLGTRLGTTF